VRIQARCAVIGTEIVDVEKQQAALIGMFTGTYFIRNIAEYATASYPAMPHRSRIIDLMR
jgi:hypothetical protein